VTDIDNITASQRILAHLHEGRLVQGTWHDEKDGREFACLLGAISPHIESLRHCPASVMPHWLSQLTVSLFDGQDMAAAMTWAGRFAEQMQRWHVLGDSSWSRVWESFCLECVADARRSARAAAAAADAARAAAAESAARAAAKAYATAAGYATAAVYATAVYAADAADDASAAAAADADAVADAARQACWTRLATALCDLIDAELKAALAAKDTP
jgi:hypothetical protein